MGAGKGVDLVDMGADLAEVVGQVAALTGDPEVGPRHHPIAEVVVEEAMEMDPPTRLGLQVVEVTVGMVMDLMIYGD